MLAEVALSDSPTERSIGFATLNALIEVDETLCVERNAEEIILERGRDVASRWSAISRSCPTCALRSGVLGVGVGSRPRRSAGRARAGGHPAGRRGGDHRHDAGQRHLRGPRHACPSGSLCPAPGGTTPLSPLLFEYGVDALSGTMLLDIPAALVAVSQGANFRQIPGKRLVTMQRSAAGLSQPFAIRHSLFAIRHLPCHSITSTSSHAGMTV